MDEAFVRGKKILVSDDLKTYHILMKEILSQDGHEVTFTFSGREALGALATEEFDIIFLDLKMGDMRGEDVLNIYLCGIVDPAPVYFITADPSADTIRDLVASGATGVIEKPPRLAGIRKVIATSCAKPEPAIKSVWTNPSTNGTADDSRSPSPIQPVVSIYINPIAIRDLRSLSDRAEFTTDLLEKAIIEMDEISLHLLTSIMECDVDNAHHWAHSLVATCSTVGADRLCFLCRKIMGASGTDLKFSRDRYMNDIRSAVALSCKEIRKYLQETTS